MTRYRVLVNGQNFLLSVDGHPKRMGFYVTRVVETAGSQEAAIAAIKLIEQDSNLYGITLNQENNPPVLDVDEIEERELA